MSDLRKHCIARHELRPASPLSDEELECWHKADHGPAGRRRMSYKHAVEDREEEGER